MPFLYRRVIRFQETDAAGVVYFANVLSLCHEAYEASLAASGIELKTFFGKSAIAFPIVHASVDLRSPMFCGEEYEISVAPQQLDASKFEIRYKVAQTDRLVSQALTVHVAIDAASRRRFELSTPILDWLKRWEPIES